MKTGKKIVDKILYFGVYKLHAKNFKLQSIASQKTENEWYIEDKLMKVSVT